MNEKEKDSAESVHLPKLILCKLGLHKKLHLPDASITKTCYVYCMRCGELLETHRVMGL